ncbi:MAG TPA: glycoside hydrolase family 31 protein [Terriglobales bacterium]|nr:glycoside hydrolase family 31 protein [Terriglobales bacterium]
MSRGPRQQPALLQRPWRRAATLRSVGIAWGLLLALALAAPAQWTLPNPVQAVARGRAGVVLTLRTGVLRLDVRAPNIVRVRFAPGAAVPERPEFVLVHRDEPAALWSLQEDAKTVTLATAELAVAVDRASGAIAFRDGAGRELLQDAVRTLTPVTVNGEAAYHAETYFAMYGSRQAFYGLGQHQAGVWNYRGESVELAQENTEIAIPMLVSSNGFGLFWHNTSRTRFDNRFVHSLYVSSDVTDDIDYFFIYGPALDRVVAGYRELTGGVPLFGRWAYGYWQSKNRYQSQAELLGVAAEYRRLHIPIDNIVQDWFWWKRMGEMSFNANYPDPAAMIAALHRQHFHLMISVWPYFERGSQVYDEMDRRGFFIARTIAPSFHPVGMALYDPTNPQAQAFYWNLLDQHLFRLGVDAWWLDTDEPETEGREENILLDHHLYIGNGARYANLYPLMAVRTVSDGQRDASRTKRVFILSRSAFAGSQRYGVTAWSGDVISDWISFRRQIPAGLNYSLSGLPYWTTDIGGFFIGNPDDPSYRELFVRWFEYGAFCPIFRVHGTRTTNHNELWSYGPQAQRILTDYDRLRYRLLPYIYSLAWRVTSENYTLMRPLAMDFRHDPRSLNIGGEFLFGPSILVSPVTVPGGTTRRLYLPPAAWYDFWTGARLAGGADVTVPAPLDRMPLHVRAGAIVPLGPEVEYAAEKPADPIELRVYPGADGSFTLYEDAGDGDQYLQGQYAIIPMHWDDARRTLTIGARQGSFPGMLASRTFDVVFVRSGRGGGIAPARPDKVVHYTGAAIEVRR